MLELAIKAGLFLVLLAVATLALNWARHPGKRKAPPITDVEALQKDLGTMDRILAFLGLFLVLFVVTMIVLFALYQQTPDALIVAVFGFCGFECGAMASIQRKKTEIRARLEEAQGRVDDSEREDKTP